MGENEKKNDLELIKKPWFIQNVMAILAKLQHALVIADIYKKEIRKVVKRIYAERRMISFLKDVIRNRLQKT